MACGQPGWAGGGGKGLLGLDRGGATRAGLLVGRAGGGGIVDVGIIEGQIDGHVSERVGGGGERGVHKEASTHVRAGRH